MEYKKPSVAASVAVYAEKDHAFLIIRRLHEPFKDFYAFPGGFLDVGKEDLVQTAVRELEEEAGIKVHPEDLQLIDVRSSPSRDPRDHVIDVGYICLIDRMNSIPNETDEARPQWVSWELLDSLPLAFDHKLYWQQIKSYLASHRER